MSETIKIYKARLRNWGDMISKPIAEVLSGRTVQDSTAPGKFVVVGSVLEYAKEGDIIWGTGSLFENPAKIASNLTFTAVRGPMTRRAIRRKGYDCPEVYGDPAMLMPYLYRPKITNKYKIGIIPHYSDIPIAHSYGQHKDIQIINIQGTIVEVMRRVAQCKVILSSSLYGLILAESLGKHTAYVRMSDNVIGGDFKFADYFASTNRDLSMIDWRNRKIVPGSSELSKAVSKALQSERAILNLTPLLKACPFNFKGYKHPYSIPTIDI